MKIVPTNGYLYTRSTEQFKLSKTQPTTLFLRLPHAGNLPLPTYATVGSAGMDISAALSAPVTLAPGQPQLIPTGFCIEIPEGFEGQLRGRSGLALKHGVGLPNSPGTIDSDYRGEISVILINWSQAPYTVHFGDRIAQLVISQVVQCNIRETDALTPTDRGEGGFGHTGFHGVGSEVNL